MHCEITLESVPGNQPVLSNEGIISSSVKQKETLMGFKRLFGRRHHKPYGFRRNPMSICCLCYVMLYVQIEK